MKFTINSKQLLSYLSLNAIASNPTLPILEDFKFSIQNNILTITSSNLETTIIKTANVTGEDGSCCIPSDILIKTLKELSNCEIVLELKGTTLFIASPHGAYKIATDNSEDFPESPSIEDGTYLNIELTELQTAFYYTIPNVSKDDLRVAMKGINISRNGQGLIFCATDAHKLATYEIETNTTAQVNIIAPLSFAKFIKSSDQGELKLSYNDTNIWAKIDNTIIISRLIDARYPDFRAVIPDHQQSIEINKSNLIGSLKRVSLFANKTTNQTIVNIGENKLELTANDDLSNGAEELVNCNSDLDLRIGFNGKFFIEILNLIIGNELHLYFGNDNQACLIKSEDENLTMLVMPVQLG